MDSGSSVISEVEKELAEHVKNNRGKAFSLSQNASVLFSKFIRELEHKRQQDSVTWQEKNWLKEADDIIERIGKYNQSLNNLGLGIHDEMLYDLKNQKLSTQTEPKYSASVPKISSDEADKIIAQIDEQFREKVLKKIKSHPADSKENNHPDFTITEAEQGNGRNLNDYLESLKEQYPNQPFLDRDSHYDLSKIKQSDVQ